MIVTLSADETPSLIVTVQLAGPTAVTVNGPAPLAGEIVNPDVVVGQAPVPPVTVSAAVKEPLKNVSVGVIETACPAALNDVIGAGVRLAVD